MKIDIISITDTEDGGASITLEVDREYLHLALEQFLLITLGEKCEEALFGNLCKAEAREVDDEEWSPSDSDQSKEETLGFNDVEPTSIGDWITELKNK